ncbi:MAG TPA: hypothetical protein VFH29_03440, partial [Anaerolineales bacterium]|nr:hypothetical protein [Anaerolineales bacterium]
MSKMLGHGRLTTPGTQEYGDIRAIRSGRDDSARSGNLEVQSPELSASAAELPLASLALWETSEARSDLP